MKVLKFGAIWCPGCLVMKPLWEEIEKENPWLQTEYYDLDKDTEMVQKYNIGDNIPVFVFLDKQGQEFLRIEGEKFKQELLDLINKNKNK